MNKWINLFPGIAGIVLLAVLLYRSEKPVLTDVNGGERILSAQEQRTYYPLLFVKNSGQWSNKITHAAMQPSRAYYFSKNGVTLVALESSKVPTPKTLNADNPGEQEDEEEDEGLKVDHAHSVSLSFNNPSPKMHAVLADKAPTLSNFYLGNNHARWRSNVENFSRLVNKNVWDNIDAAYEGKDGHLFQTFVFHPGAKLSDASMTLNDADNCGVFRVVSAYQKIGGNDVNITARISSKGENLAFEFGSYDKSQTLHVQTDFSTFFGGSGDETGIQLYVDDDDNIYLAGLTTSMDFPLVKPAQDSIAAGYSTTFLAKFLNDGKTLAFSTYLGGWQSSTLLGVKPGADNTVILAGSSTGGNFPLTAMAAVDTSTGRWISRVTSDGALLYSSYLWGDEKQIQLWSGMTTDLCGNVYFIGHTYTTPDMVTADALIKTKQGEENAFIMKLAPTCDAILYGTIFGNNAHMEPGGIAVDKDGNMIVTGVFPSGLNYPLINPFQTIYGGSIEGYIAKISADGQRLVYSSYVGGSAEDQANLLTTDNDGNAFLAGMTNSPNFPVLNAAQDTLVGTHGRYDIFVTKISPSGSLLYSTYFGGDSTDLVVATEADPCGNIVFCGKTYSMNYPLVTPWQNLHGIGAFITIIDSTGSKVLLSTNWGTVGSTRCW